MIAGAQSRISLPANRRGKRLHNSAEVIVIAERVAFRGGPNSSHQTTSENLHSHSKYGILTKRPEKIDKTTLPADWWPDGWAKQWRHVWLGVSAEDQHFADKRMDMLRNIPTRVRWVSCEPLLAPVALNLTDYHLVVDGAETGSRARPAQLNWFRSIRDQCAQAKVCYIHLQNGRAFNNGKKCNCHKLPDYTLGVGCPGKVPGCRLLDGQLYQQFPAP